MQLSTMLTLALASFTAVSAVPSPFNGPSSNDVRRGAYESLKRAADNTNKVKSGQICNIRHNEADCHGAYGDKVNTRCTCLYDILEPFPHPGKPVYTCQPAGSRNEC